MPFDRISSAVTLSARIQSAAWKCILLLLPLLSVAHFSYTQVYPVQATVQLTPPYSLYLADYVESGEERLALNIFLSDIARPDLDVRFRLKIIGQGIKLETKPGYLPPPVSLQGGVPLRLISTDLADYFNPNNLTFEGLSQREYAQRGKLPEGVYQFCFEVLEYNRGLKISNTACAVAWLVLNDPPIVNLPRQNEKLKTQSVQNVLFQWTPRHTGSPNSAFTTEYEIKMVEVWPESRNPNDAILTSPPILQETTRNTTYVYGPAETPLEPGRRYAVRIQAKSVSGVDELDLFKNHGYSEVVSFVYGDACDLPTGISVASVGPSRFAIEWQSQFNHTAFKVRYRREGTVDWYEHDATLESAQIVSLKPSTTYEYQVAATCGFFDGAYTPIARVTTAEEVPADYSCGVPLTPFNLDPAELTGSLRPGDIIDAGDFQVQLVSVSGSNGVFSGEGVVEVPYLNKAKVKTSFTNITVNKELRMVDGFMNVTGAAVDVIPQGILDGMEQLSEVLDEVDTALDIIEENLPEQIDWTSFVADTLIAVSGEIMAVNKNEDGTVTVTDTNGNTQTLPAGNNYALKDDAGNGYLVDKKGNVHTTNSALATRAANREYNLLVTFRNDVGSEYGFDHSGFNPPDDTEVLPEGYKVAWKSVASGSVDGVIASVAGSDIDKSKIRFELGGVDVLVPPIGADQTSRITVTGRSFEALLALYTPSDSAKEQVLGKLNVASYDALRRKLVIVPVNSSLFPSELTARSIADSLNSIYHQAVVHWEVEIKPAIQVALSDQFDDGGSGLLNNYTGDMKKVINAYGALEEDTYYLFLVSNPSSGVGLGYMPRGKEAGFIFVDKHGSTQALVRTMAHELGHGAFNLAHTFEEPNFPLAKGTTDNLMDYPAGNKLYKFQWDKMRYPDIVVGLFEEDEAGAYTAMRMTDLDQIETLLNDNAYIGLTPDGRIITKVESAMGGQSIVPMISASAKYVITGFSIYSDLQLVRRYQWIPDQLGYFDEGHKLGVTTIQTAGNVRVYILSEDGCTYKAQVISWDSATGGLDNITQFLDGKVVDRNWRLSTLFNADASCLRSFVSEIVSRDKSDVCANPDEVERGRTELLRFANASSVEDEQLIETINGVCKLSIQSLEYNSIKVLFTKLAQASRIKERHEIALLRLASSIKSANYKDFYALLEENGNSLIKKLVAQLHDKSIYPWDGDHYTSFIGGLVTMFSENPASYLERLADAGNEALLGQVFNLQPKRFKSDLDFGGSGLIPLNEYRYLGAYDVETGRITIKIEERVLSGAGLAGPRGPAAFPVWTPNGDEWPDISPLSPLVITSNGDLPLVKTALGEPQEVGNVYVVPAIFLKFKGDKEFNDAAERAGIITLDAVTVVASGGTMLATKVHWARRLWAFAELAGAAGSIAINSGALSPESHSGRAVEIFNAAMAVIGLKNLGEGLVNFTRKLPQETKAILDNNGNLRDLLQSDYAEFTAALNEARRSGEWDALDDVTKELVTKQEGLFNRLVDEATWISKTDASNVTGAYDWGLVRRYFQHVQDVTGRPVPQMQVDRLKEALRAKVYSKLNDTDYANHTRLFTPTKRNELIARWEKETGQVWPTYTTAVYSKGGNLLRDVGAKYDAHHIIEQSFGGEHEWWNIHPAKFPSEHQGGIHGANSPARELFK